MQRSTWNNCYSQQWAGILIPAAFAHPAKISLALVKKIFAHALEQNWIKKGDTCLDPFAGIGGVAFGAMSAGLNFVGQELEPHFVDLANSIACTGISKTDWVQFYGRWEKANRRNGRHWCPNCIAQVKETVEQSVKTMDLFEPPLSASYQRNSGKIPSTMPHRFEGNLEFWKRKFGLDGAVILQGDSRRLLKNLRDKVECVVSSPPFQDNGVNLGAVGDTNAMRQQIHNSSKRNSAYGKNKNQLGNLPAGNFDAVISSPPYASSVHSGNGIDPDKLTGNKAGKNSQAFSQGYGDSPAQLAAMPEGRFDITVSSPPFEDNGSKYGIDGDVNFAKKWQELHGKRILGGPFGYFNKTYGKSENQLGNESGATFWSAAREIVEQCFLALKPGGHAIWVVKDFLRNGKRVEFCEQWRLLCETVGFKTTCTHRAMLVTEITGQQTLAGKIEKKVIKRSSFFRKLSEKSAKAKAFFESLSEDEKKRWIENTRAKFHNLSESRILQRARLEAYKAHGEPEPKEQLDVVIDWEMVICMVKPAKTFTRLVLNGTNGKNELKTEKVVL